MLSSRLRLFCLAGTLPVVLAADGMQTLSAAPARLQGPRYLALASDRAGGQGGLDVYVHDRITGQMVPLPALNTPGDETRPVLGAGGTLLAYTAPWTARTASARMYDVFGQRKTEIPGLEKDTTATGPALSGNGNVFAFARAATVKGKPSGSQVVVFSRSLGRYLTPNKLAEQAGERSDVAVSADGAWFAYVYRSEQPAVPGTIVLHDLLTGASFPVPAQGLPGECAYPSLSGDGRLISFASRSTSDPRAWDVHVYDRVKQALVSTPNLNSSEAEERSSLSRDGRFLAFETRRAGSWDVRLYDLRRREFVDIPGLNTPGTERHPSLSQE